MADARPPHALTRLRTPAAHRPHLTPGDLRPKRRPSRACGRARPATEVIARHTARGPMRRPPRAQSHPRISTERRAHAAAQSCRYIVSTCNPRLTCRLRMPCAHAVCECRRSTRPRQRASRSTIAHRGMPSLTAGCVAPTRPLAPPAATQSASHKHATRAAAAEATSSGRAADDEQRMYTRACARSSRALTRLPFLAPSTCA